jgi:hypothetical protein
MHRTLWVVALAGCETTGTLYGGGAGLTVSADGGATTLAAAGRGTLADARADDAFTEASSYAYVPVGDVGTYVRGRGDVFSATTFATELGLPCGERARGYDVWIGPSGVTVVYTSQAGVEPDTTTFGESTADLPDFDPLSGAVDVALEWTAPIAGCADGDLPSNLALQWAFDAEVAVTVQCVACFEIPGDLQFE